MSVKCIMCCVLLYFLLLVVPSRTCSPEDVIVNDDVDTELVMAFMILRHGDRSPVVKTMPYITDKEKVLSLIEKTGYGQLTKSGKRRSYKTGAFIRRRYGGLLSSQYNQSEIYIRTTDSTRTKMTILTAMSAVYPAVESWCEDVEWCEDNNWTPVPYNMDAAIYDFNMAFFNCPTYITYYNNASKGPAPEMSKHFKFLDEWSNIISYNITAQPAKAYMIYDAYISQINMGVPLEPRLVAILPLIQKAAAAGINVVFGNDDYLHFGAGVLLKEFFKAANRVKSGEDVPKVYVYSAHDVNVYALMAVTRARPLIGPPKYGSLYSLELRRVVETGEYIVKPVFLQTPDDNDVLNLEIEGCEGLCELSRFHELVSKYELDVKEWRRQCKWSEDYDFDYKLIN